MSATIKTGCVVLAIAIGGIVTLPPVPAAALTARASASSNVQRARRHFLDGKRAFERKSYAAALKEFEAGYAIEPRPGFLLNMGHAARRMGDLRRAHALYVKFLATAPPPAERRAAVKAVAEIERELPAERQVSLAPPPVAPPAEAVSPTPLATAAAESSPVAVALEPPARAPSAAASTEPEAEAEAAPARRAVSPAASRRRLELAPSRAAIDVGATLAEHPRASNEKEPPIYQRWWFWASAGGVAAGVATAIVIGSLSSGSSARDRGTWGQLKL
jgi:tetratricopeptide (TPR) repeat protein